jgi:hypothetical protein
MVIAALATWLTRFVSVVTVVVASVEMTRLSLRKPTWCRESGAPSASLYV